MDKYPGVESNISGWYAMTKENYYVSTNGVISKWVAPFSLFFKTKEEAQAMLDKVLNYEKHLPNSFSAKELEQIRQSLNKTDTTDSLATLRLKIANMLLDTIETKKI